MDSKSTDLPEDAADQAPKPRTRLSFASRPARHRADTLDAGQVGDVMTRLAVVLLSSINAVMWWIYTEAPVIATMWAIIAVAFAIWIAKESSR
jgi:hypothetical protein